MILLVEEHGDSRELMRVLFEAGGFEVSECDGGDRALDTIVSLRPDVVILNGYMRGEDGWSVCRRLRACGDWSVSDTPVIFVSTSRGAGELNAFAAGCDVFLLKPVDISHLLGTAAKLVARRRTLH
jgi:CheY-like chemotaxis protein